MRVVYVAGFEIVGESPGLQRVTGIGRSLAHAGHEVVVLGAGPSLVERELAPDVLGVAVPERSAGAVRTVLSGRDLAHRLDAVGRPDVVISYGGDAFHTRAVQRWCHAADVPAVLDSVEWYDRSHLRGGRYGAQSLLNEYCMRYSYPRYAAVIAVSSMLEEHYRSRGCRTLRVPPTLDVLSISPSSCGGGQRLRLAYAGTPGKKDLLAEVVRGVAMVDPAGDRVQLDVLGVEEQALARLKGGAAADRAAVRAHGRVSRAVALELVAAADFVPLLRPNRRYANAGFPTKIAEAMAHGTPAIANLTSDLGDVVCNDQTGVVVARPSAECFASALERALELSELERLRMRDAARQQALASFDFRGYSDALDRLIVSSKASCR